MSEAVREILEFKLQRRGRLGGVKKSTQWKGAKKEGQSLRIWKSVEEALLEMTLREAEQTILLETS